MLMPTKAKQDRCCCYLCGASCSDWTAEQDPFIRHAETSPTCALVVLHKSKGYSGREEGGVAPWSPSVLDARIQTFTDAWPHSDSISAEKV